jgi:hypothetical protein
MSVRAYRIETKTVKGRDWTSSVKTPTFNCWNDFDLFNFLRNHEETVDQTNSEGCGTLSINIDAIKEAIKKAKVLKIDKDVSKNLTNDLAVAEKNNDETIDYDCY